jgi:polar amino acid transport system substrate-binding protein
MLRGLVLAVVAVLMVIASAARADTLGDVRARGELRWAGDIQGGEPYVFDDPSTPGKLVGFEVEIAAALARRLGVRATFVQCDWSNLVPSLERGDFDVVMNGLERTTERRARILLSRPYFVYRETLAVATSNGATSLDDLAGKRIGTLNQTFASQLLRARGFEPVLYEGVQEPYVDLAQGRIDGVLLENIIADRYGCSVAGVRCVEREVARGSYVIGLRKGDAALERAISDALGEMQRDGELRRILEGWKLWGPDQRELEDAHAADAVDRPNDHDVDVARFDRGKVVLFLQGAAVTLALTCSAFAIALPLGLLLAIARLYGGNVGRVASAAYVEVLRGTPVLLQLYILYYGIAPFVRLGPMTAAILGLGLNYAAYEAEVHRGALMALPRGQSEAAAALGLTRVQTLRHVLLPQSLRHALPAITNDFVALLKDSSLVSVITVVELTKRMTIASVEVRGWLVPGLLCAALYFAMSFPLARLSRTLEKRLHRDSHPRLA